MDKQFTFEEKIEIIRILIQKNKCLEFHFEGSSMLPTIESGKVIKVKKCETLSVGKIYMYIDKDQDSFDKFVSHRLVKRVDSLYYFKGDNRNIMDTPVRKEDVIGRVVSWS